MKINLFQISIIQRKLDNYIHENNNIIVEEIFEKKQLAFLVELGEFINEVRSFKWWSKKPSSEKEVVLEEYVDALHFIVSLGIDLDNQEWEVSVKESTDINEQVLNIYTLMGMLRKTPTLENYQLVLIEFLGIINTMNWTFEEIEESYLKKNQTNYERQDSNY